MESARARCNAAPWAAWTAVIDELATHLGMSDAEELLGLLPCVEQRVASLHSKLVQQSAPACIAHATPTRALSIGATQKYLVSHVHKGVLKALRVQMDNNQAAFHRAASGPGAGAFLEVPLDNRWVMTNRGFATATRRRLGLAHPGQPKTGSWAGALDLK